jgi:hypothetical protein
MKTIEKYKPAVSKRALLFIAGCVWMFAGGMLIYRGLSNLIPLHHYLFPEMMIALAAGICFYIFLFTKISKKHIIRISLIEVDRPCFFSFFNFKSYVLMLIMISAGITLRKLNIINHELIFTFYVAMGFPLLLSAVRFFIAGIKNIIKV